MGVGGPPRGSGVQWSYRNGNKKKDILWTRVVEGKGRGPMIEIGSIAMEGLRDPILR
jgi:hypothetical protein